MAALALPPIKRRKWVAIFPLPYLNIWIKFSLIFIKMFGLRVQVSLVGIEMFTNWFRFSLNICRLDGTLLVVRILFQKYILVANVTGTHKIFFYQYWSLCALHVDLENKKMIWLLNFERPHPHNPLPLYSATCYSGANNWRQTSG